MLASKMIWSGIKRTQDFLGWEILEVLPDGMVRR